MYIVKIRGKYSDMHPYSNRWEAQAYADLVRGAVSHMDETDYWLWQTAKDYEFASGLRPLEYTALAINRNFKVSKVNKKPMIDSIEFQVFNLADSIYSSAGIRYNITRITEKSLTLKDSLGKWFPIGVNNFISLLQQGVYCKQQIA